MKKGAAVLMLANVAEVLVPTTHTTKQPHNKGKGGVASTAILSLHFTFGPLRA